MLTRFRCPPAPLSPAPGYGRYDDAPPPSRYDDPPPPRYDEPPPGRYDERAGGDFLVESRLHARSQRGPHGQLAGSEQKRREE